MGVTITAPVGYHGKAGGNRAKDVFSIHDLLSRVPPSKGGAGASLDPKTPYSPKTDQIILNFQKFNSVPVADATVHPDRETLALLNKLAEGGSWIKPPSPQPRPYLPPQPSTQPEPLKVLAVMTSMIVGHGYVRSYDNKTGMSVGRFRVPLYRLKLGLADGSEDSWKLSGPSMDFEVIRFGVYVDSTAYALKPSFKNFQIWGPPVGEFALNRHRYMDGSWLIYRNYYIHVGPKNPHFKSDDSDLKLVASLGCIELCWPGGMVRFDDAVRTFSFGQATGIGDHTEEHARISQSQSFRCLVEPASNPPLLPLTDFRDIGGPNPISG